MRTTHVGSLVRPDELIAFLRQLDKKDPAYDEAAHMECLARSVQGVVAKQKEAGVDIVSDGEYGKSAWNYYVYERLGGIELRPHPPGEANFASVNENPTDWARFPEFYAEYFAKEQDFEAPGGDWACVSEVTYTGGDAINRDIANLKAAMEANGVDGGLPPGRRAGELLPESHRRALRLGGRRAHGHRRGAARGVQGDRRRRPVRADRRRVHPVHVRRHRASGDDGRTTRRGRSRASTRSTTPSRASRRTGSATTSAGARWNGPHTNDIAAARRPRPHVPGQRGDVPVRERQPAPRARVAGVGGRRAARRARSSRRA